MTGTVYWTAGDISQELGLTVGGANYWVNKLGLKEDLPRTRKGVLLLTPEQAEVVMEMYRTYKARRKTRRAQAEAGVSWRQISQEKRLQDLRDAATAKRKLAALEQQPPNPEDQARAERALQYLLTKEQA